MRFSEMSEQNKAYVSGLVYSLRHAPVPDWVMRWNVNSLSLETGSEIPVALLKKRDCPTIENPVAAGYRDRFFESLDVVPDYIAKQAGLQLRREMSEFYFNWMIGLKTRPPYYAGYKFGLLLPDYLAGDASEIIERLKWLDAITFARFSSDMNFLCSREELDSYMRQVRDSSKLV